MVSQSTQKPTAWRIERFNKISGKREHDETEYDTEPSPDFLANMGRSWRVVVTELHAGPQPDVLIALGESLAIIRAIFGDDCDAYRHIYSIYDAAQGAA